MKKNLVVGLVVGLVLITGTWSYLFHDYISGNRWIWVKYKLGTLKSGHIFQGKEGFLFSMEGGQADLDDYRGLANPGNKVDRLKDTLIKRNEIVRLLGGRLLYLIAPIGENVYNELLPRQYQKVGNRRRATLAMDAMRGTGVDVLYLTPAVTEGKARGRVFYKFDSHWNWLGAYIGSQAVISHLSKSYPAMKSSLSRLSDFDLLYTPIKNIRNYGNQLGTALQESDPEVVPRGGWTTRMETKQFGKYKADVFTKDDKSLPNMVMFGDSFMAKMRRVLAENFRRAVFVNPWVTATKPLPDSFTDFPVEIIEAEKPEIVLYDRWERAFLLSPLEWSINARLPSVRKPGS
jgi:hypothetical protein